MSTRLLETSFDTKFHALQIIFVRMSATSIFSLLYMWHQKIPDAPFGDPHVRGLLILRGMAGFIGLFGIYCKLRYYLHESFSINQWLTSDSLSYLNLSDATVITFLTPILTAFLCFVALRVCYIPCSKRLHSDCHSGTFYDQRGPGWARCTNWRSIYCATDVYISRQNCGRRVSTLDGPAR